MERYWSTICAVILATLLSPNPCVAPGVNKKYKEAEDKVYGDIEGLNPKQKQDREFLRYLLRVFKALELDPAWEIRQKYISDKEAISKGKLTDGLVRLLKVETKERLARLKKEELQFQLDLLKNDKIHMVDPERNEWNPMHQSEEEQEYFTQNDLDLILGRFKGVLALKDAKRREKFKEHEMEKELKFREDYEKANEYEKKAMDEKRKKYAERPREKMHDPLHEAQLKEVWEKADHLDPESFDARTIFKLHDKDGNGYLDEFEVETFFLLDLEKRYPDEDPDTDHMEKDEEMERMREGARDVDTDGDGLISLAELLAFEKSSKYKEDVEYKPLTDERDFTEEEFAEYVEELKKGKEESSNY